MGRYIEPHTESIDGLMSLQDQDQSSVDSCRRPSKVRWGKNITFHSTDSALSLLACLSVPITNVRGVPNRFFNVFKKISSYGKETKMTL